MDSQTPLPYGNLIRFVAAAGSAMVCLSVLESSIGGALAFSVIALCMSPLSAVIWACYSLALVLGYPFVASLFGPNTFDYVYPLSALVLALVFVATGRPTVVSKFQSQGRVWSIAQAWLRAATLWVVTACLVMMLFNAFPLIDCFVGIVAAVLMRSRIGQPTEHKLKSTKERIATAVLLIVSLVIAVAVLEIGARIIIKPVPPLANQMYMPDGKYIYRLRPNATIHHEFKTGRDTTEVVAGRVSAQGLRDEYVPPKESGEYRVLLLGDSFTFGVVKDVEQTISRQLQRMLEARAPNKRIRVINLGMGGTGPWQQRGYLLDTGFAFKPDIVVHQLFLSNDISNTLNETREYLDACYEDWEFSVALQRMLALRRYRMEAALSLHSAAYLVFKRTIGREEVSDFLATGVRVWEPVRAPTRPRTNGRPVSMEVDLDAWYPKLQRGWDKLIDDVIATARDCEKRDVKYVVYNVPYYEEICDGIWTYHSDPAVYGVSYERAKAHRLLGEAMKHDGIEWIPTYQIFKAYKDPDALYYADGTEVFDGHLTLKGNELIASQIATYIEGRWVQEDSGRGK